MLCLGFGLWVNVADKNVSGREGDNEQKLFLDYFKQLLVMSGFGSWAVLSGLLHWFSPQWGRRIMAFTSTSKRVLAQGALGGEIMLLTEAIVVI